MTKFRELSIAVLRTSVVPPIAGWIIAVALRAGLDLSEKSNTVLYFTTVIVSGIYYCLLHGLEVLARNARVRKWAGIFLGYPKKPTYVRSEREPNE